MPVFQRIVLSLSHQRFAAVAIYLGMLQYAALWIFEAYQSQLLAFGLILYLFRMPYFIKIGERAFVAQSAFFFCVESIALFHSIDTSGLPWFECYAIF